MRFFFIIAIGLPLIISCNANGPITSKDLKGEFSFSSCKSDQLVAKVSTTPTFQLEQAESGSKISFIATVHCSSDASYSTYLENELIQVVQNSASISSKCVCEKDITIITDAPYEDLQYVTKLEFQELMYEKSGTQKVWGGIFLSTGDVEIEFRFSRRHGMAFETGMSHFSLAHTGTAVGFGTGLVLAPVTGGMSVLFAAPLGTIMGLRFGLGGVNDGT